MNEQQAYADILRLAKLRISDPDHFVMGVWAWDRKGRDIDPLSSDAFRWSARGAIYVESGVRPKPWKERNRDHVLYRLLDRAARQLPHERPSAWGLGVQVHECKCRHQVDDNLGHEITLQALEMAAVMAETGVDIDAPTAPEPRPAEGA